MEERKVSLKWRFVYRIYEAIFMTKPRVAHHCEPKQFVIRKKHQKSLDGGESDSDDDLNANEMLDKYANLDDSLRVDPDFDLREVDEDSTDDSSSSTSDSDDGKTESQRKLNSECEN